MKYSNETCLVFFLINLDGTQKNIQAVRSVTNVKLIELGTMDGSQITGATHGLSKYYNLTDFIK